MDDMTDEELVEMEKELRKQRNRRKSQRADDPPTPSANEIPAEEDSSIGESELSEDDSFKTSSEGTRGSRTGRDYGDDEDEEDLDNPRTDRSRGSAFRRGGEEY